MKKQVFLVLSVLLMVTLACSLPSVKPDSEDTEKPDDGGGILLGKNEPSPNPVSFNEGLASLDSYQFTLRINSIGPDPDTSSAYTVESERSKDSDSSYSHINSTSTPSDEYDTGSSDTYTYRVGNDRCNGSEEEGWTYDTSTDAERELQELANRLLGFIPLIENPSFVGEEEINGIETNHFTFNVSGLGARSGAEVRENQGDYWLAVDGQYLVKYSLIIEMSMEADAEIVRQEIQLEMKQVNQPVSISFPQGCIDASLETPEAED